MSSLLTFFFINLAMRFHSDFYLNHRGFIINLVSLALFWWWSPGFADGGGAIGLAVLVFLALLAEPWAIYYSMGVFNARREEQDIKPILLHRLVNGLFMALLFWGGRLSLYGALLVSFTQKVSGGGFMDTYWISVPFIIFLFVREGFATYYMTTTKPFKQFSESLDFLADIVLVILITIGELLFKELIVEVGITHPSVFIEKPITLFPILLFGLVFYLPIRYVYTLEDFTFADTTAKKIERVGSFILVLLVLIMR